MTAQPEKSSSEAESITTNEPASNLQDEIRRRAYEIYEQRGRQDGHDLDDWLQSELETIMEHKVRLAA